MKKIILHLGVHKTATTHIQSILKNSKTELNENGLEYIELGNLRKLITSNLSTNDFSSETLKEIIESYLKENDTLILSDENFLGGVNRPYNNKIYPEATTNLAKLYQATRSFEVNVHLTIRNYTDYFISRYSESLRHFKACEFESFYKNLDFRVADWCTTVQDIIDAGFNKVNIIDFKDMIKNQEDYFKTLLGSHILLAPADQGASIQRSKISQETYNIIKLLSQNYPPAVSKKTMRFIDNNPQITPPTIFTPFSEEHQQELQIKYMKDIEKLKNNEFINFIEF